MINQELLASVLMGTNAEEAINKEIEAAAIQKTKLDIKIRELKRIQEMLGHDPEKWEQPKHHTRASMDEIYGGGDQNVWRQPHVVRSGDVEITITPQSVEDLENFLACQAEKNRDSYQGSAQKDSYDLDNIIKNRHNMSMDSLRSHPQHIELYIEDCD